MTSIHNSVIGTSCLLWLMSEATEGDLASASFLFWSNLPRLMIGTPKQSHPHHPRFFVVYSTASRSHHLAPNLLRPKHLSRQAFAKAMLRNPPYLLCALARRQSLPRARLPRLRARFQCQL